MEDASGMEIHSPNTHITPVPQAWLSRSDQDKRDGGLLLRRQWMRGGLRIRVHGILVPALLSGLGQAHVSPWASVSPLTLEP